MLEDLERIIKKAALDGMLTNAAAEQVHETIEKNRTLRREKEDLESEVRDLKTERTSLLVDLEQLRSQASGVAEREKAVTERETKMTELELEAKHQAERVLDHQVMFEKVFRNMEVRRSVFTVVPGLPATDGTFSPATLPFVSENEQKERAE